MALLETNPIGLMAEVVRMRLCLDDMVEHTVSPEMLDRFAAGSANRGERRVVVRHLLEGCSSCRHRLGSFLNIEHAQEPEGVYDGILDRVLDRSLAELELQTARTA